MQINMPSIFLNRDVPLFASREMLKCGLFRVRMHSESAEKCASGFLVGRESGKMSSSWHTALALSPSERL